LYVEEAINSILNQTYSHFEFLIIDDASTDATKVIIKKIEDERIQLIEKPLNTGYTNSLNYGLTIARGKYIARMDGDDISLPERFQKQLAFLESNPAFVLCGTSYKVIGNSKNIVIPETNDAIRLGLLKGNCILHPSVMLRKKVLDDFSILYDITKEPAEDYALWAHLLSFGKLHNLSQVLMLYRLHTGQVSRKRIEEQKKIDILTKFKLLQFLGIDWQPKEYEILEKFFKPNTVIDFNEIGLFKQVLGKLTEANGNHFFESIGFKKYLLEMESLVLMKCFFRQKRHSPRMYLDYLKAKFKWGAKLSTEQEIKLGIKSLLFKKVTRV
jgi:glycosyltransferase involved in cell wall biosynthesis